MYNAYVIVYCFTINYSIKKANNSVNDKNLTHPIYGISPCISK